MCAMASAVVDAWPGEMREDHDGLPLSQITRLRKSCLSRERYLCGLATQPHGIRRTMLALAFRFACAALLGFGLLGARAADAEPAQPSERPSTDFAAVVRCQGIMNVVRVVLQEQRNGVPIEAAYGGAQPYQSAAPSYRFLISAIDHAYADPQAIEAALDDGRLRRMCFAQIRRD